MPRRLNLTVAAAVVCLFAGCATQTQPIISTVPGQRLHNVRTTAYTQSERGGRRNALGMYLSGRHVISAASDWSRFPLGTRFRLVDTNEEYIIDDYGTALIGTGTIDLYKPTRLEMKKWGCRMVDIDILQWGSEEQSLKVLAPRKKHRTVRRMIAALEKRQADQKKQLVATLERKKAEQKKKT